MTARPNLRQMQQPPMFEDWIGYPMHLGHGGIAGGDTSAADDMLVRSDGAGLLYWRRVHSLYGPSESGKSWVALMVVCDVVKTGERAVFFDFEDAGFGEIAARLIMLGLSVEELDRVVYVRPSGHPTPEKWDALWQSFKGGILASLSVVDSVNGALAEMGLSPNSTEDVTVWHKAFVEPLKENTMGSLLLVDHVPTAPKNGRAPSPIGSQAKRAMITGSSFRVDVHTPLRPGHVGVLDLFVSKDRPGAVRKIAGPVLPDKTQHAARIRFDARLETAIRTSVDPPPMTVEAAFSGGGIAPATDPRAEKKEQISRVLENGPQPSGSALFKAVGGDHNEVLELVRELERDGFIHKDHHAPGSKKPVKHTLIRSFRVTPDPESNTTKSDDLEK